MNDSLNFFVPSTGSVLYFFSEMENLQLQKGKKRNIKKLFNLKRRKNKFIIVWLMDFKSARGLKFLSDVVHLRFPFVSA